MIIGGTTVTEDSIGSFELQTDAVESNNIKNRAVLGEKIQTHVTLEGNSKTTTQDRDDTGTQIATTLNVSKNRVVVALVTGYSSVDQPLNTLAVTLDKVGGLTHTSSATSNIKSGDIIRYFAPTAEIEWCACVVLVLNAAQVRIYQSGHTYKGLTTNGFTGGNVGYLAVAKISPVK